MKMIRATLKLALVLYICAALSGVYVLSASARITPHEGDDDTMLITIEKGDTLWALCQEYLEDPLRWQELSKYNDFTNPHLIYPGEKLRIPLAMAKKVIELAEDQEVVDTEALERLRVDLAEALARRDLLDEANKDLTAKIEKFNKDLEDLQKQLTEKEDFGEEVEALTEQFGEEVEALTEQFGEEVEALTEGLEAAKTKAQENSQKTEEALTSLQTKLEATDTRIESIQADIKMLLAKIEMNQKAISEFKMLMKDAKGVHEEMSSSKRALVVLTTLAAGIGWFALNVIGGRSSE